MIAGILTLLGRLSSSRATNLDKVDLNISTVNNSISTVSTQVTTSNTALNNLISTKANASTALSTSVWTSTKAGYLDANVSLVAGAVWNVSTRTLTSSPTVIKTIQRGAYTGNGSVTITTVNRNKSFLTTSVKSGYRLEPAVYAFGVSSGAALVSNTKIEIYQNTAVEANSVLYWEVVEFN